MFNLRDSSAIKQVHCKHFLLRQSFHSYCLVRRATFANYFSKSKTNYVYFLSLIHQQNTFTIIEVNYWHLWFNSGTTFVHTWRCQKEFTFFWFLQVWAMTHIGFTCLYWILHIIHKMSFQQVTFRLEIIFLNFPQIQTSLN